MKFLLETLNRLFDPLSFGTSLGARYAFMAITGLISALVFLYIYKLISNQARIKRFKNAIWGNILQMRIYQDNLRVILTSILKVLGYNVLYLKEMVLPMLVLLPVLAVFTIQVNNRCGYKPLEDGEVTVVKVRVAGGVDLGQVMLETRGGIVLQTPALRAPDENAVYWRAGVEQAAKENALMVIRGDGQTETEKQLALDGHAGKRFDPVLCKWSWSEGLAHNAEGFLPDDSKLESISIDYSRQQYPLLWWDTDSLVVYFVLVLVFALAFKPMFRVTL